LHRLEQGELVKVLLITRNSRSERRVRVSKSLAGQYDYLLTILGEPERAIDVKRLTAFLKQEIKEGDEAYIPDFDNHIDHRVINQTCKGVLKGNTLVEYAVYNNTRNPMRRVKHKLLSLMYKKGFPSFKKGKEENRFSFKLAVKNDSVIQFLEKPRDADILRRL